MLAYRNPEFLDSDDARPLRILAEYLAPLHAFEQQRVHDTIVFFGSARIVARRSASVATTTRRASWRA